MAEYVLLISFLVVLAFFLFETKSWISVIAVWLVFLGNLFNQIAVMANGGKMPVFLPHDSDVLKLSVLASPYHTLGDTMTRFAIFSDWIDIPQLDATASIGDVFIVLSLCWLLVYACYGTVVFTCTVIRARKLPVNRFKISYPVCLSVILVTYLVVFLDYVFFN